MLTEVLHHLQDQDIIGMVSYKYIHTNLSLGWVVEKLEVSKDRCDSWMLIPAVNLWPIWVRALLYLLALLYMFLGIAIASDVFMAAIERITSKKRSITIVDDKTGEIIHEEVYIWNETVANLSLMALGSSISEILLATLESIFALGNIDTGVRNESLGLFTIIGSAAFNLLCISGICVLSVPSPGVKSIKMFGVFLVTSIFSILAYVWMMIVIVFNSPMEIEPWEAWFTFLLFPILVFLAYCQDRKWWLHKCMEKSRGASLVSSNKIGDATIIENELKLEKMGNGRVTSEDMENNMVSYNTRASIVSRASTVLSKILDDNEDIPVKQSVRRVGMRQKRALFRHLAITQMTGSKVKSKPNRLNHNLRAYSTASLTSATQTADKDLTGKFAFKSPKYSVIESDGKVSIDVLFYRKFPLETFQLERTNQSTTKTEFTINGKAEIDFETCEGSAKEDTDYKHTSGTLVFEEGICLQTLIIPIVDDYQYENDRDFYVLLKRPRGVSVGIAEPSVTKVTIIDDDDPGEFSFESGHIHSVTFNKIQVVIMRNHGCDGTASMEINTKDDSAIGGTDLKLGVDYVSMTQETVTFQHGEMEKSLFITINPEAQKGKMFTVTLSNLSDGCRIGEFSTALCIIGEADENTKFLETLDDFGEDIEAEVSWADQFRNAMKIDEPVNEVGEVVKGNCLIYLLHFISFFWRLVVAIIPPKKFLGAYPTFICSLLILGFMTALVEQLGNLFGCIVNLNKAITGITLVALGTSLPDTFASRTAALHDDSADNSIGNITGSNAVNVFLGLGIPWVISSMYALVKNKRYCVNPKNLFQSIVVFISCAVTALLFLMFRRFVFKGELGGKRTSKIMSGIFLIVLWFVYVIVVSLKSDGILIWDFKISSGNCPSN